MSDGSNREPPWATKNNDIVCEDCIKKIFVNASRYDISWPARWGAEILDIAQFQSILPANFVDTYKEKEMLTQRRHATAGSDIPMQVLGVDYQLCPWCRIAFCRERGSNHINCPCGASLCFICGNAAFDRPGGFNHWGHGGCPRYGTIGSGSEQFSDGQYNNSEPHLVPLGRVYGTLLYVNGHDEHFGEVYKDNTKLCWQTCNHKHDLFDQHGRKWHPFEIRRSLTCLKFNLAMQAAAEAPHKGVTLRHLLDNHVGPITTAQRMVILSAMSKVSPPSTPDVTHAQVLKENRTLVRSLEWYDEEFVDDVIALRPQINESLGQYYPFALCNISHHLGLLYTPIGGIFCMHSLAHRTNALKWLNSTVTNFQSNDEPNNLALFSVLGPPDKSMQILFSSLQGRVLALPYHQITFEVFTNGVLLVWVRQHSEAGPGTLKARMPFGIMERWRAAFMIPEQYDFQRLGLAPIQERRPSH